MTNGIDVSHWNNRIHWPQVSHDDQEITFAMAKATEGETFQDFRFIENFDEMKENHIQAGAYHVFRMTSTPNGQVENITKILEEAGFDHGEDKLVISTTAGICSPGQKIPCDDPAKNTNEFRAASLSDLLTKLEGAGYNPILFVKTEFWDKYFIQEQYNFSKYPLWVSDKSGAIEPIIPKDWKDAGKSYEYWHYNCKGKIAGIEGDVCLDQTHLEREDYFLPRSDLNPENPEHHHEDDMWEVRNDFSM